MYWLVENKKQFDTFVNIINSELYIEAIPDYFNNHPCEQSIIGYYIRPITDKKGYILPINHYETGNLQQNDIVNFLNTNIEPTLNFKRRPEGYVPPDGEVNMDQIMGLMNSK